ncbi:hypothetical protein BH09CHL1_BH09CHL1_25570 [soil metagenome]
MSRERLRLGELETVIPVLETRMIGDLALTLISLEIWDSCFSLNFSATYPSQRHKGIGTITRLAIRILAGDGPPITAEMRTGHGGGSRTGNDHHRFEFRVPPMDLTRRLQIDAELRIGEYEIPPPDAETGLSGYDPSQLDTRWTDIGTARYDLVSPSFIGIQKSTELLKPPLLNQLPRNGPIEDAPPSRIVPILQTQRSDDWLLTLIALELSENGMLLTSRTRGPRGSGRRMPTLRIAVRDDLGNGYAVWPSAGGGDGSFGERIQWRWFTSIEPAVDRNARALFVDVLPDYESLDVQIRPAPVLDFEALLGFAIDFSGENTALK